MDFGELKIDGVIDTGALSSAIPKPTYAKFDYSLHIQE